MIEHKHMNLSLVRQYQDGSGAWKLVDRSKPVEAQLNVNADSPAKSTVLVQWKTPGYVTPLEFNLRDGLQRGRPRAMWRIHPEDVDVLCSRLGLRPKPMALPALKGRQRNPKAAKVDPRQESLLGGAE